MRHFIILLSFLFLMVLSSLGANKPTAPIRVPETRITESDLYKTLQHAQEIVHLQAVDLEAAKEENKVVKEELEKAHSANSAAQSNADSLQVKVNEVTDSRNQEASLKDSALDKVDAQKGEISKLNLKVGVLNLEIGKLKFVISAEAGLAVAFLLLWLGVPKFSMQVGLYPIPIGLILTAAAVLGAFSLTWKLL